MVENIVRLPPKRLVTRPATLADIRRGEERFCLPASANEDKFLIYMQARPYKDHDGAAICLGSMMLAKARFHFSGLAEFAPDRIKIFAAVGSRASGHAALYELEKGRWASVSSSIMLRIPPSDG